MDVGGEDARLAQVQGHALDLEFELEVELWKDRMLVQKQVQVRQEAAA